jgi:iron complex outermembrane recepter protein
LYDVQSKEPLVGASILAIDASATTDATGAFTFKTNASTLRISYIGYEALTVPVPESGYIDIAVAPTTASLEAIIVSASREAQKRSDAPIAISKIGPDIIKGTKAQALPELISKVPGVFMMRFTGEGHSMSIRQPLSTSAYFLYMEDGVPVRPMGLFNHNGLIETNIMALNSIEVVKGPASSIYGPEAVGGAINLITSRPTAVPTFSVGYQGDSYNYKRFQANAGGMLTKRLGVFAGGFIGSQRKGWRERTDYVKNALNARVEYHLSEKTLLTGAYAYNFYDGQEGLSLDSIAYYSRTYEASNDFMYRSILAQRSRLTLNHRWNDHAESFITAFHRFNDYRMSPNHTLRWTTGSKTATSEKNQSIFNSYGVVAQHVQRFDFMNSKLIVGSAFDYTPQRFNAFQIGLNADLRSDGRSVKKYTFVEDRPNVLLSDYAAQVRSTGLYGQLEVNPFRHAKLTLGGRYDVFSFDYENFIDQSTGTRSYAQFSPKAGITYSLGQNSGLYANYSLGFAPPGVTAIFRRRPNPQPGQDLFYYNLAPARFVNAEVGGWVALWQKKVVLEATLYDLQGQNELLSIRQPDNSTDFQSAGRTLHRGVEFGATIMPVRDLQIRIGGANALHQFIDFRLSDRPTDVVQKLDGYEMPASPKWIVNTEVIYTPHWAKGLRVSAEWQRLTPWFLNQINTVRFEDRGFLNQKGVSVLNLRVGYEWRGIELFVSALNATNELYVASASRGNAAADRTNFSPSAPRSIGFGLQYNFVGKRR